MAKDPGAKDPNVNKMAGGEAVIRRIRVRKEDSAFVYAVLEANEGLAAYSTLDHAPGEAYRDLELIVPVSLRDELEGLLKQLGDLVYDLDHEQ